MASSLDAPGVVVTAVDTPFYPEAGLAHLCFDDVRLPRDMIVGRTGRGMAGFARHISTERFVSGIWASALCRRTLADTGNSHLAMSSGQLLLGTVQLAVAAPLAAPAPGSYPLLPLLSVLALGALGTGVAFLIQYGLVAEVGPTTAMMVTYFVPVIATAAGVLILGEHLTWNTPVGAAIILIGAALTQRR